MKRQPTPVRERAATDAHHRRHGADRRRNRCGAPVPWHRIAEMTPFQRQEHLHGDEQGHDSEHRCQHACVHGGCEQTSAQRPEEQGYGPAPGQLDVDSAAPVMRARGGHGRRHDGGKRGGDGKVHAHRRVDTQRGECQLEHGDDDDAAAHTEQTRDDATHEAGGQHERDEAGERSTLHAVRSAPSLRTSGLRGPAGAH